MNLLVKKYSEFDIRFLPNPTDNGFDGWQPSLKRLGTELKIKETTIEELYEIEELLFLSLEYSELINTTKFKSQKLFNIHFSLLPEYKGMYTSALPIINGEEYSGVTLHKIPNINLPNVKNWTAIIIATYNGHLNIVKSLAKFGADINSTNKNGTTLLMYALSYFQRTHDSEIFEFLLESGSNSNSKDKNNKSLKDYIIQNNCEKLLKYLD